MSNEKKDDECPETGEGLSENDHNNGENRAGSRQSSFFKRISEEHDKLMNNPNQTARLQQLLYGPDSGSMVVMFTPKIAPGPETERPIFDITAEPKKLIP